MSSVYLRHSSYIYISSLQSVLTFRYPWHSLWQALRMHWHRIVHPVLSVGGGGNEEDCNEKKGSSDIFYLWTGLAIYSVVQMWLIFTEMSTSQKAFLGVHYTFRYVEEWGEIRIPIRNILYRELRIDGGINRVGREKGEVGKTIKEIKMAKYFGCFPKTGLFSDYYLSYEHHSEVGSCLFVNKILFDVSQEKE